MFHHSLEHHCCPLQDGTSLGLVLTKVGQSIDTTDKCIYYSHRDEAVSNYLVIFMVEIDWLPSFFAGRKRLTMLI